MLAVSTDPAHSLGDALGRRLGPEPVRIPLAGILIALFAVEQLVNGCRNGFERDEEVDDPLLVRKIEAIAPVPAAGERP